MGGPRCCVAARFLAVESIEAIFGSGRFSLASHQMRNIFSSHSASKSCPEGVFTRLPCMNEVGHHEGVEKWVVEEKRATGLR